MYVQLWIWPHTLRAVDGCPALALVYSTYINRMMPKTSSKLIRPPEHSYNSVLMRVCSRAEFTARSHWFQLGVCLAWIPDTIKILSWLLTTGPQYTFHRHNCYLQNLAWSPPNWPFWGMIGMGEVMK